MSKKEVEQESFKFVLNSSDNGTLTWHSELEVVFILEGMGTLEIDGDIYEVGPEDIFVINSHTLHNLIMASGGQVLSFYLSSMFINKLCPEVGSFVVACSSFLYPQDKQHKFHGLRKRLALAFRAQYKQESPLPLHMYARIMELLDYLLQNFRVRNGKVKSQTEGISRMREITQYMNAAYREDLTLTMLAEREFLSNSYLSRLFQKELGITFTEYLTGIRLSHALVMLQSGNESITDIAYASGFKNTNSFIDYFKQKYKVTPGQYRKKMQISGKAKAVSLGEGNVVSTAIDSLLKYASHTKAPEIDYNLQVEQIKIDCQDVVDDVNLAWKRLINVGYAKDILLSAVQSQLTDLQKEIGFKYLRFHGIFDDDMMVYSEDNEGNPILNFTYVDMIFDFLLSINFLPYVEFSYMPSKLAMKDIRIFRRPSVISMPKDLSKWCYLIEEFVKHCIERYGISSVSKWLFCPWTGSEFGEMFHVYTRGEYYGLYKASFDTVKQIDENLRVCGPGSTLSALEFMDDFLGFCSRERCVPDLLAVHCYHGLELGEMDENIHLVERDDVFPIAISGDQHYIKKQMGLLKKSLEKKGVGDLPVLLDEWNSNLWQRDLCNDTSYKSAYLFKNILENYDETWAFGYWNVSDFMEEIAPAREVFHGGFGLFTRDGIKKSGYRAFELLNKMGTQLLEKGDGYFVTKTRQGIQIFVYHYVHYDLMYRYRHASNMSHLERYDVFNQTESKVLHIQLKGLKTGGYIKRQYSVSPKGGSAYDEWLLMGAPEDMDIEELTYLKTRSMPEYFVEKAKVEDLFTIKVVLVPHEIQVITLTKQ